MNYIKSVIYLVIFLLMFEKLCSKEIFILGSKNSIRFDPIFAETSIHARMSTIFNKNSIDIFSSIGCSTLHNYFSSSHGLSSPPTCSLLLESEARWWVSLKRSVCVWVRFLRNTTTGKSKRTHCGSLRAVVKRALYAIFTYRRRISNADDVGEYCLRRTKTIVHKTVLSNFSFFFCNDETSTSIYS